MAWDQDWDNANRLQIQRAYLDELRVAIKERSVVFRHTPDSFFDDPIESLSTFRPIAAKMETEMDTLLANGGNRPFVNHTDNSGNWEGQDEYAPKWTEAAILADISIGETRLPVPAELDGGTAVAWMVQQKEMIDRMRWTRRTSDFVFEGGNSADERQVSGHPSYGAAVTAWNAASWSSILGGTMPLHFAGTNGGGHIIGRKRQELMVDLEHYAGYQKTWEIYHGFDTPAGIGTYENLDYPGATTSGTYGISKQNATPNSDDVFTIELGYIDSVTATRAGRGWAMHPHIVSSWPGQGDGAMFAIHKWNVAGGLIKVT